jgi:APA family basic amino acid/polyamine antiporter
VPGGQRRPAVELVRGLGPWDGTLLVIGSVLGTGIFLTTDDMARVLPHEGLLLLVWLAGGALTLAGALAYGELGTMFPRAGGIYHFLKEAYGALPAFLYGWCGFLVIMSGGIAAIAVGFAEYLGSFVPFCGTANRLASATLLGAEWRLSGGQLTAGAAILALTAVNWLGLRAGATVNNLLTTIKVAAIGGFALLAFAVPARAPLALAAPVRASGLAAAFGIALVAALWSYDGWYGLTFSAGEMREPSRDLPRALVLGTAACTALYVLVNVVYFRALSLDEVATTERLGEAAAGALFGAGGARALAAAIVVSAFGCLASNILYSARLYLPMAQDGLFFRSLGEVHGRFRTPGRSLWAQGGWATLLALTGSFEQLYTYVVFVAVLFHAATGAAVFVLRRRRPGAPRPYRAWGYPVVPALFVLASLWLAVNTLIERPTESLLGLGLLLLGLPVYRAWRLRSRALTAP